jgi:molecular chaperone DnaK (HSP70)
VSERTFGIGVDLGTSMSAVSRVDISSGTYSFFEAQDLGGAREIPSVAYVHPDGRMDFGEIAARRQYSANDAPRVVTNVKLLLRENDPLQLPGLETPVFPNDIIRGLLAHLKKCFEMSAHIPCARAVITVPAYQEFDVDFKSGVRQAVMGGEALFESIDIVAEPDAVLLAMGNLSQFDGERVLVFDMGGGTLDVSIREVEMREDRPFLRQLAVTGSDAAGRRVTEALADQLLSRRQEIQGFSYSNAELLQAKQINFLEVDDVKRQLSSLQARNDDQSVTCSLMCPSGRSQFSVTIRAAEFASLVKPIELAALETLESALDDAGLQASDVDRYFMVGGSSRLVQIRNMAVDLFGGRKPNPLQGDFGVIDSTLSVVRGAAIADLERSESGSVPMTVRVPELERLMPYSISMLVNSKRETEVLVPKDSTLPYGPVEKVLYVPETGDTHIDFVLLRGSGDPSDCVNILPRTVELFEPAVAGEELRVSWFVEKSGELTLIAHDHKNRELTTMRAGSADKEI